MGKMKKLGVFFSIMSIFIIILFVSLSTILSKFTIEETELDITRDRVSVLNSVVSDMEEIYFEKMIYVAAKNSLIGLSKYYHENQYGSRVKRTAEANMRTLLYEGILVEPNGEKINLTTITFNADNQPYINKSYTIKGLKEDVVKMFDEMGVIVNEFNINISTGNMDQIDPWTIQIKADIYYDFEDKSKIVSWSGLTEKTVKIPVYGIYAYDYFPGPGKGNFGVITKEWKEDKNAKTEPSLIKKLSNQNNNKTNGICSKLATCDG